MLVLSVPRLRPGFHHNGHVSDMPAMESAVENRRYYFCCGDILLGCHFAADGERHFAGYGCGVEGAGKEVHEFGYGCF